MTDTFKDDKLDWGYINAHEPELLSEEPGVEYLYDFEFLKGPLVVATYTAVFDHVLSREEVVKYFQQFYEVRDEQYNLRYKPPVPIYTQERQLVIDGLKRELGGFMRMASNTVDLQDTDKAIERYVESPAIQKRLKTKKRIRTAFNNPIITSKEV